jgi:hypothetical protein
MPLQPQTQAQASDVRPFVPEDGPLVVLAVTVNLFKDQDAIASSRTSQPDGIGVVLGNPEPPSGIDGERDRLNHVGLGGEEGRVKSFGKSHFPGSVGGRDR